MRILHIIAQKPDSTGSGIYLSETVSALSRFGHSQAIIAGINRDDSPQFEHDILFRPVYFESDELPFPVVGMSNVMPYRATRYRDLTPPMTTQFQSAFLHALNDVLSRFKPNLIICHHLYLLCATLTHEIARKRKDSNTLNDCIICGLSHSTDIRQMKQIPLERNFIREGIQMLDRIYALHDAQAAEIQKVYDVDPARICVVGTGYNARIFYDRGNLRQNNTARLVYAGKIYRKKGVESLLRAFNLLVKHIPHAELTLAGGYNDKQEYESILAYAAQLHLPIHFTGKLNQEYLAAEFNKADVFVLPSFFEGLPLVAIEALACGCKEVLTNLPGIKPWIQANTKGGIIEYVEPPRMQNVDEPLKCDLPAFENRLAEAMERAVTSPSVTCNTSNATWDALAKRLISSA